MGAVGIGDASIEQADALLGDTLMRLPDCGERRVGQGRKADVVEPSDQDVKWHAHSATPELAQHAHGDLVVAADDGIGQALLGDYAPCCDAVPIPP